MRDLGILVVDQHLIFMTRLIIFAALHSFLAVPPVKERIMQLARLSRPAYRLG